jgi:hypothetical protein
MKNDLINKALSASSALDKAYNDVGQYGGKVNPETVLQMIRAQNTDLFGGMDDAELFTRLQAQPGWQERLKRMPAFKGFVPQSAGSSAPTTPSEVPGTPPPAQSPTPQIPATGSAPQAPDLQSQARQAIALSLGGKHQNVRQAPMTGGGIGFTFGERLPGQGPSHAQQEGLRQAYTGLPPGARAPSTNRPETDLSAPPKPIEMPAPPPSPEPPGPNRWATLGAPSAPSATPDVPAPPPMPEAPAPKSRAVANISRPDLGKPGERATL